MPSHRLIHESVKQRLAAAPVPPVWPSYSGRSQFVGTIADGRCTVWYDPSLGAAGLANATDLLADAPRVMEFNDGTFGTLGGHVDVIVFSLGGATDGTGGADHMGCDFTTGAQIEVCASFGQSARVSALFEAELSECSMNGQLCGSSTGEALSRWCAMEVSNNALADFATAPQWAADGMPNFVDTVDPTDQNADSTGCGMAFLSFIMSDKGLGLALAAVAQAMVKNGDGGTLAQLWTDSTTAWAAFTAAISGLPNGVTSDDPFNALGTPQPQPGSTGPTGPGPQPGPTGATGCTGATGPSGGLSNFGWAFLAMDAILTGLQNGETAGQIKGDIAGIPT